MTKIRIKDIAEKAGVSIGTVDRVLHSRGEVAEKTREKVKRIADEMHYQPNLVARALTSRKSYEIAVLIPRGNANNIYWLKHPEGIRKAVQELQPFRIEVRFFYFELHNESEFRESSSKVVEMAPDGVIMAPILKKEAVEFCRRLDGAAIPYLFIDTFVPDVNPLNFIGEDAWQSGRVAASLIDCGVAPDKDILIVNIAKDLENTQHLNSRNQGFQSYFLDTGQNQGLKISVEVPLASRDTMMERLKQVFDSHPHIGGIYVSSAKTHIVARYLHQAGLKNMTLTGHEITRKNIEFMRRGIIRFLIAQKPDEQAAIGLKNLFNYLSGNQVPQKSEYQPINIINNENRIYYQQI